MKIYVNKKSKDIYISSGDIICSNISDIVYMVVGTDKYDKFLVVDLRTGKTINLLCGGTTITTGIVTTYSSDDVKDFIIRCNYKLIKSNNCVMNIDVEEN